MDDSECMICLEDMKYNIAILKCGHKMHFECVSSWIKTKKNITNFCPLCNIPNEIVNIINADNSKIVEQAHEITNKCLNDNLNSNRNVQINMRNTQINRRNISKRNNCIIL